MSSSWSNTEPLNHYGWTCGYCGKVVGGNVGYRRYSKSENDKWIYICPYCENPTAIIKNYKNYSKDQYPSAVYGNAVGSLPETVDSLYSEIRCCIQYGAYTAAVLAMRKLLMHIAVEQGAAENKNFVAYIDYLKERGLIPPSAIEWVSEIRTLGNEANHEITMMSEEDAKQLLDFAEMLLKIIYEYPAKIRKQ